MLTTFYDLIANPDAYRVMWRDGELFVEIADAPATLEAEASGSRLEERSVARPLPRSAASPRIGGLRLGKRRDRSEFTSKSMRHLSRGRHRVIGERVAPPARA